MGVATSLTLCKVCYKNKKTKKKQTNKKKQNKTKQNKKKTKQNKQNKTKKKTKQTNKQTKKQPTGLSNAPTLRVCSLDASKSQRAYIILSQFTCKSKYAVTKVLALMLNLET